MTMTITIHLDDDHHRFPRVSQCFPLDDMSVRETFDPLDYPMPGAMPLQNYFCTRPEVIKMTEKRRAAWAKQISAALTTAILDQMAARDTQGGYKKESP